MRKTLIQNSTFLTMNDENPIVTGSMIIENDFITFIGELTEDQRQTHTFDEIIDGSHKLYMPGLINTHGHAAMSLLRGYADDQVLKVWLEEKMWPMEEKFTAHDVHTGTLLSIVEMLKSGTTCFVDMYDKMDEVAKAVEQSGIRATLTRGMIGFPIEVQDAKLKEATEFAQNWHGKANGRIKTMMSPHSPYTCPPDFIEKVVQAAHDLDLPLHTHMSETLAEVLQNERDYGLRPVEHLEKLGMFSRPCLVAHAVHLTDKEIEILQQHQVMVSHNPISNLKLASGIARVPELLKSGILVSLGTDSSASNNNLDLFEEIRLAAMLHKTVTGDPTVVPAKQALQMGTINGAQTLGLRDVGKLGVGMKADFIALDIEQPHFYPRTDLISHVVYAARGSDVVDVCIDGNWVVRNRACTTLDEEKILYDANECFNRLAHNG